jgi:hypothetical protein
VNRFVRERQLGTHQAPARLFVWPFEMMLRLQANMAGAIRESTENWMERRQKAAGDALEALERLIHCNDIGEAVAIQQEWLEGTIQRASDDIDAFANQGAAISREAASSAQEAGTRTFYSAHAAARQAEDQTGESLRAGGGRERKSEAEGKHQAHQTTRRRSRERHGA